VGGAGAAVGFAGLTGLREDFLLLVGNEVGARRSATLYELKLVVEDIIFDLGQRYSGRLAPGEEFVEGILVGLERLRSGRAQLYHLVGGYAEKVKFCAIGHGSPYAVSVAKFLFEPAPGGLSVEEAGRLATFVLSWVREDVDTTVGGDPKVLLFRHEQPEAEELDRRSKDEMIAKAQDVKASFRRFLGV
jgi:hypothetical protein